MFTVDVLFSYMSYLSCVFCVADDGMECSVPVLLDGEESIMEFIDLPYTGVSPRLTYPVVQSNLSNVTAQTTEKLWSLKTRGLLTQMSYNVKCTFKGLKK